MTPYWDILAPGFAMGSMDGRNARRKARRARRKERRVERRSKRREKRMERRQSKKGISSSQAQVLRDVQATAQTTASDPYATIENQSRTPQVQPESGGIGVLPILLGLGVAAYAVMQ